MSGDFHFLASMNHTPGPWEWWTSNSWKRLKRDARGITQNVLEPYVCSDGHPDVTVSEADMRLIAAAPDLATALHQIAIGASEAHDGLAYSEIAEIASKALAKAGL